MQYRVQPSESSPDSGQLNDQGDNSNVLCRQEIFPSEVDRSLTNQLSMVRLNSQVGCQQEEFKEAELPPVSGDGQADNWPTILSTFYTFVGNFYFLKFRTLVARSVGGPKASPVCQALDRLTAGQQLQTIV